MAEVRSGPKDDPRTRSRLRWPLRLLVIGYLFFLVIWPVALVAKETFGEGLAPVIAALQQPEVIFAFQLTLSVAFWAVVINTVFGVGISMLWSATPPRPARAVGPGRPAAVGVADRGRPRLLLATQGRGGAGWTLESPGSGDLANRPG